MMNVGLVTIKAYTGGNDSCPVILRINNIDCNSIEVIKQGTREIKDVPVLMKCTRTSQEYKWFNVGTMNVNVKYIYMFGSYFKLCNMELKDVDVLNTFDIQRKHLIVNNNLIRKPYVRFSVIGRDKVIRAYEKMESFDTLEEMKRNTDDMEIDITQCELDEILARQSYVLESSVK